MPFLTISTIIKQVVEDKGGIMLINTPRNYISIRDLLDDYQNKNDEKSKNIVYLLLCTKHFLAETSADYQKEREADMTDDIMQEILNNAAKGFMRFSSLPKIEWQDAEDILAYCRLAMIERLALLQHNHDILFTYYATHDNALKATLMTTNQHQLK